MALMVMAAAQHVDLWSFLAVQVVEELFTYWNLDQTDDELEQLEELLIVSRSSY